MTRTPTAAPPSYSALPDSPVTRFLFADARMAVVWLIARLYVGWLWLEAGLAKVGSPEWTGAQAGEGVRGFLNGAIQKAGGESPDVSGWYARFLENVALPNAGLFSYLVAYGELAVGIALILGLLTGAAAFFGGVMNLAYLLAGTLSSNPLLLVAAALLVAAWRVAGWWGLDRFVLPRLTRHALAPPLRTRN
ncbi:DoxX family protein [Deinococcus sp. Leaf326]|uniref:DoxX family protein n=1 Tax=Deinococcus sp. Leaf326 TaxID=1736338 RepID=UPI0006FB28E7|nr:DoxX family protein [Deinococcus sp. Leaf326]KQR27902.1 DoxX family protein [Deinococcus sp. Leaf326]